ncbi:MAG TPA: outer membrane lipid asymmetry maintenance protein MlaD [Candidatus Binataceae bacterium]|jgi:phospholipid/cholesterol/gamma-HCH transport system substrate-binding protein|nr:outer membrane lipid asymmetry maintenance protein MlaD [Candidatus Binataceae bacterium]
MYASRTTQFLVGIFALAGLTALAFLSFRLGKLELFAPPGYVIYASFDNVSGLKSGDDVEIDGVSVGKVISISLSNDRAKVTMRIDRGIKIDDEAIAAIRTRGIIGDKYVAISPGPSDKYLVNGGVLRQTESAFVLEDAIGQLINNMGSGGSKKQSTEKGSDDSAPTITDPGSATPQPSAK